MYMEEIYSLKVIYFTHQTNNHPDTKKSDATHGYLLDKKHDSHNMSTSRHNCNVARVT